MDAPTELAVRFARQMLLPEVGAAGQARLCAATARIAADGLAGEIGARYAERAGFAAVAHVTASADEVPEAWVRAPAARAVLAGARAAQRAILAALDGEGGRS